MASLKTLSFMVGKLDYFSIQRVIDRLADMDCSVCQAAYNTLKAYYELGYQLP